MFYEVQCLQVLSKSSDMKSLIKSFTKKILCVAFLYAKWILRKLDQNHTHKISRLSCPSQSKYFNRSGKTGPKILIIWNKYFLLSHMTLCYLENTWFGITKAFITVSRSDALVISKIIQLTLRKSNVIQVFFSWILGLMKRRRYSFSGIYLS